MAFVRHTTNNINSLTPLKPYGLIWINNFIHVAFSLKAFGTVNHKMLSKNINQLVAWHRVLYYASPFLT